MTTKPKNADSAELIAGRFKPDSICGLAFQLLSDGKARTISEIAKVTKPKSVANLSAGRLPTLRRYGKQTGQFDLTQTDGKWQLRKTKKTATKTK